MSDAFQDEMEHQPSDRHLAREQVFPRCRSGSEGDPDRLHTPGPAQNWRESLFFGFFGEKGQTGMAYVSLSPNKRMAVRMIVITMPKSEKALVCLQQETLPIHEDAVLERGALQFRCLAPLHRWRLQADVVCLAVPNSGELTSVLAAAQADPAGVERVPVAFDLRFEARMPAYRYPDNALDFLGRGQQHFEQMGKVSGWLRTDSAKAPFSALASRDRSWGVRDWLRPESYTWAHLAFEKMCVGAVLGRSQGGERSSGYVYRDRRFDPIARVVMNTDHDPRNLHLLSGGARIVTAAGKELEVVFEPLSFFHVILARGGATQCHDSVTTVICRCDGQVGQGVLEHERREVLAQSPRKKAGVW